MRTHIQRELDRLKRQMVSLGNSMLSAPSIQIMSIARHLERMADHATGIAEDLIFLIEGRNVRHTAVVSDTASRR